MKPCTCAQRGPVTTETDEPGKVRVVCCYCWRKTQTLATAEAAIAAWNSGRAK